MSDIEKRLAELGVILPDAPTPLANYVPFVVVGNMVHISGQISQTAAGPIKGRLGADLDVAVAGDRQDAQRFTQLPCTRRVMNGLREGGSGRTDRIKRV